MSGTLVMLTAFLCLNATMKDGLLTTMSNISTFSLAKEPGVLKYALLTPRGNPNGRLMYSFEEYTSQAAFNSHLQQDPVKAMFAWSSAGGGIFDGQPVTNTLQDLSGGTFRFSKPGVQQDGRDPHIVVEEHEYGMLSKSQLGSLNDSHKALVAASLAENGTLFYGVFSLSSSASTRRVTVAAYESVEYFDEVHSKNPAVVKHESNKGWTKTEVSELVLQKRGGFMHR